MMVNVLLGTRRPVSWGSVIRLGALAFALAATCGCDSDCPLQDGKTYEMLIVERYDENTVFAYDPLISIPACNLDDFRAGDRYHVTAHVGGGDEDCDADYELLDTPTGLASLETHGVAKTATTPSGCVGSWRLVMISGADPREESIQGQPPKALLHRDFQPTSGCDIPNGLCRDRFVVQLF
jgi:hypothetical protein